MELEECCDEEFFSKDIMDLADQVTGIVLDVDKKRQNGMSEEDLRKSIDEGMRDISLYRKVTGGEMATAIIISAFKLFGRNRQIDEEESWMEDYKQRCINEYQELITRINKLDAMLTKYDAGKLDFEPTCPIWLLKKQLEAMRSYAAILIARNNYEHMW